MEERRRSKRVPVDNIVMYQAQNYPDINLNENSKVDTPVSVNIGSGGLQIETNQHLAEGTYLQIVFSIPETNIAVQLNGKVIWVQDNKKKNYFQIGIEFIDFKDKAKKKLIDEYIKKTD